MDRHTTLNEVGHDPNMYAMNGDNRYLHSSMEGLAVYLKERIYNRNQNKPEKLLPSQGA
jgi:hypothetical protein